MRYRVIFGEFIIVGKQPDADSVKFRPDDPGLFGGLQGKPVDPASTDGTVQLRFQGGDAAELHYGTSRQPVAKYSRNVLLYMMGFGRVRYNGLTVRDAQNRVEGAILTRGTDTHGRPISYLLLEEDRAGLTDGMQLEDAEVTPLLPASLNYRMTTAGMLYYLVYDSMPAAHRELFREAAAAARAAGLGVWVQDYTSEFELLTHGSIGPDGDLIFPKLFRRCTDYLRARDQENFTRTFTEWMRASGPENDPVRVRGEVKTFADLVRESDGTVALQEDTLDLVFIERPSVPGNT